MTKNQLLKILALKNIKVTPIPTEGTVLIFGATAADTEPVYYIGASGSTTYGILVNAGETLTIDWGDGTTSVSTATGLNAFAHQYSTTTNRVVTITSTGTIRFNGN